ncbi:taurine ABC transporter ATP-binding protein [Methylophilus flavus]|uniref:Taurine ABC transporter ATP-binding protein n=1 Tax=Methylophilus flavus TaxID=640084 RepID=A0ABW3PFT1_9PROT
MSTLTVNQVTASFTRAGGEQRTVLRDISVTILPQEIVVIVGPSGCGKTTLLNLVAGFEQPTSGDILLNGKQVSGPGPDRGVIFQQHTLLPWLTVGENVEFGLKLQGISPASRAVTSAEYLNLVGLSQYVDCQVWNLSGGMKQRVSLARALVTNPQILLMDEPFGALDAFTKEQMQTLVLNIWHATHKQILLVTHDIEEAVFLATKLILMKANPGQIAQVIPLDFGKRHISGESARSIKSDPDFIKVREAVLAYFFENDPGVSNAVAA